MKQQHRSGFTLIELLVVIAIIGMLISILLPSLGKARRSARDTQCLSRLRALIVANTTYEQEYGKFSNLNNDLDDGAWQYNYLIWDDHDFEENFGPLVVDGGPIQDIVQLFCPRQKDAFHTQNTVVNPWPVQPGIDTRSSYGRRYHLSGKSLSQLHGTVAFAADVLQFPRVIRSGHVTGVNAVYTDGHAQWVLDPGILLDNELSSTLTPVDNPIMEDIWDALDEAS